ncbi:DUF5343 domain-containing protein [Aquiflexum gelatinilyticum]|uniref:DUF5343 domain-containing protein n=1 Tax=Aquiflexum gelatinilyticum TaxID=2961943 RepID=A0A9X2SZD4_9BACT|nr:DUF5343 domain-containing protein [Aquiflexum gelatinilyticum]MCR9013806.1 DUF5343 domain-containing protein [Aquiflexum gelatinilyticum]
MALPTAYLVTTKNLQPIINSLISAKAPDKLTGGFLKTLGFTSSNDTLYVKLFKEIGLIDANGTPTSKYYEFIDQSQTAKILATCIEEGYSDLFAINKQAYKMTEEEVKNKLKTLTQGTIDESILKLMAKTFKALTEIADWSVSHSKPAKKLEETEDTKVFHQHSQINLPASSNESVINPTLHYNIQIHLPETRDSSVYDAIFKSLKQHLL